MTNLDSTATDEEVHRTMTRVCEKGFRNVLAVEAEIEHSSKTGFA